MPPTGTTVAPLYALLGVARLGATRLGYVSPQTFVSINGTQYADGRDVPAHKVLLDSLSITDGLDDVPNTAALRVMGFTPTLGADVIIRLGSKRGPILFTGTILRSKQSFAGTPATPVHDLALIDHTWGLNTHKVSGHFTGSASTIFQTLIATYAPDYTAQVASGLPTIDGGITFTFQDLTSAISQLAARGGYEWTVTDRTVHLFLPPSTVGTPPSELTASNAALLFSPPIGVSRDLSQFITRVLMEGRGSTTLDGITVGETIIPVADILPYLPDGGVVVSGPQRITYTGVLTGGAGSLVGPGAAPASAPTATVQSGAGMTSGLHEIAVVFVTAAGTSIPGPRVSVTVGFQAAPTAAPTPMLAVGTGIESGNQDYIFTHVTSSGETTGGATSGTVTTGPVTGGTIANPTSAPSVALDDGTGMDLGAFQYGATFTNAVGETLASPLSSSITTTAAATDPGAYFTNYGDSTGGGIVGNLTTGNYQWKYTYKRNSDGAETLPSGATPVLAWTAAIGHAPSLQTNPPAAPAGYSIQMYRTAVNGSVFKRTTVVGWDDTADASLGANAPTANTTAFRRVTVTSIPIGGVGTTGRKVYRTTAGGSQLKLLQTIANNTVTQITDSSPDSSLGANAPTVNTTGSTVNWNQVSVSIPAIASANVTNWRLYRRFNGAGTFKLVATIAKATTTYLDAIPNGSLGAVLPTTNTATANQVALTGIPIGPTGTLKRWFFMTAVGSSQLKYVTEIADNTTTGGVITMADAALSDNAPTSDTSGLTQPEGVVLAGSTSLIAAGTAWARSAGGWAIIGNGALVRYTGISGSSLTGIPVSGPGAILATIDYNSTITAAPSLIGIPASGAGSVLYAILKGEDVNILAQVDDLAAQTTLAALLTTDTVVHDGVIEDYLQDRRLSYAEAVARGEAHLLARNQVDVQITYQTRDRNSKAGQTVSVTLGAPTNVTADLIIQSVTIGTFHPTAGPIYSVTAATHRYSFSDLLRLEGSV